jgi:diguanylate cyclase (GGDEF)-like protein
MARMRIPDGRGDLAQLWLPVGAGIAFFVATLHGIHLARLVANVAALWIPNGILLAILLLRPDRAGALFLAGTLASVAANLATDHGFAATLIISTGNMAEVGVAAWALRRWAGPAPLFTQVAGVVRFTLVAGVAAPAVGATLSAAALSQVDGRFLDIWGRWFVGDALGLLIITPVLVILDQRWRQGPDAILAARSPREITGLLVGTAALALVVFSISAEAALFVLPPVVLVATFRMGPFGAAATCVVIAAIGVWQTAHGHGPVAQFDGPELVRILHFQLFLAMLFLSALPVAAALFERQVLATELTAACDAARSAAESFYDQASTDELTGVATRRRFLERLREEVAAARVRGGNLALVVLDVDHFKTINDTHGHPAGDQVLRTIADTCRAATRSRDLVGRLGGEEFALLMPGATPDGAAAVCERLRRAVAASRIEADSGVSLRATVSLGLASLHGQDDDRLLGDADRALYEAKRSGRNRLAVAA